ncbi:MAG TPA: hypothetical protein VM933_06735 [Acidimicrobiales bacterium]|nr:hypothetical protein [Acidimicrobiales bacterium]
MTCEVAVDLSRLGDGDLFEAAFFVEGLRVEVLAEVEISGTTLHLRDIAIYPAGVVRPVGLRALLAVVRTELFSAARTAGFEALRITGTRLTGSNPGRIVDLTIDLSRDAT